MNSFLYMYDVWHKLNKILTFSRHFIEGVYALGSVRLDEGKHVRYVSSQELADEAGGGRRERWRGLASREEGHLNKVTTC